MSWRRLVGLGLALCASSATAQLTVQSFPLDPYVPVLDGQWQGIKFASDGACYFASSTHDNRHGAAFFRYRPETGELTMLTNDITRVCGEDPTVTPPQGKIHSDIVEHDGWLYFATHLGNYWPEAETNYTGAHVLGYELATGNFRDFGVIRSNYTIYAGIGVDPVRNKLITYTTHYDFVPVESYLYRIDIATGAKELLGAAPGHATFWYFVDRSGDCWLSPSDSGGALLRVNSASGTVDQWPNALPESGERFWAWAQPLDGDRCVFRLQAGNGLYIFDAAQFRTNPATAFSTVQNIGPYALGLAAAPDRVFYIQRANQQEGQQEYQDFHLLSVALSTGAILDLGLIADQSGRLVWRIPGMATDPQGRLGMVGDWWLLPGEQGSPTGTLRHVDGPGTNYTAEVRGEFFATVTMWPILTNQPQSQSVLTNTTVTLTGGASGLSPLAYQWQFESTNLSGATNTHLSIPNAQLTNSGAYRLIVSNPLGSVTSAVAQITVSVPVSTNAYLAGLTLDTGLITPPFDPLMTGYAATVNDAVTSVTVTATSADSAAQIQARINDEPLQTLSSGSPSVPLVLGCGLNMIDLLTIAQDGITTQNYTVAITVVDTTPPLIACPATMIQPAALGESSLTVTFPTPPATDNCPGVTVVCVPTSGTAFPVGSNTTVNCTATDASGNTAACAFQVITPLPATVLGGIALADGTWIVAAGQPTTLTAGIGTPGCVWNFGDGTIISNCEAAYTFTNCQPQTVTVTIGDETSVTNQSLSVQPACPMTLAAESVRLRWNRRGLDILAARGWLNLPTNFVPTGVQVAVQAGDVQQLVTLDRRGRGASTNGVLRLTFNKRRGWAFNCRFTGIWRDDWAANGLTNETVRNRPVHLLLFLIANADPLQAFVGGLPLRYSAVKDKWGKASK